MRGRTKKKDIAKGARALRDSDDSDDDDDDDGSASGSGSDRKGAGRATPAKEKAAPRGNQIESDEDD